MTRKKASTYFQNFSHDEIWIEDGLRSEHSEIYCDNERTPRIVLLCPQHRTSFLANPLDDLIEQDIEVITMWIRKLQNNNMTRYICISSQIWIPILKRILGKAYQEINRVSYIYNLAFCDFRIMGTKQELEDKKIKKLEQNDFTEIANHVDSSISVFWNSSSDFSTNALGYGVWVNDLLASVAWSAFKPTKKLEIAVSTRPEFRGQGLANLACDFLIKECLIQGISPHWTTNFNNISARKLAEDLGFNEEKQHIWIKCL